MYISTNIKMDGWNKQHTKHKNCKDARWYRRYHGLKKCPHLYILKAFGTALHFCNDFSKVATAAGYTRPLGASATFCHRHPLQKKAVKLREKKCHTHYKIALLSWIFTIWTISSNMCLKASKSGIKKLSFTCGTWRCSAYFTAICLSDNEILSEKHCVLGVEQEETWWVSKMERDTWMSLLAH